MVLTSTTFLSNNVGYRDTQINLADIFFHLFYSAS